MSNSKHPQYRQLLPTVLWLFLPVVCASLAAAEGDYGNLPPDANMMGMSSLESVDLPFDPNNYTFLVYDPCGSEPSIVAAMEHILGRPLTQDEIRTGQQGRHVTPEDLATHDILIAGWNYYGDTSGLDKDILAAGITGRVILTGHDLDYHTADPYNPIPAAQTMLVQAIDFVLAGGGTGLITLGCTDAFPYLPEAWPVSATSSGGEDVDEFTEEGLASGVYDGLEPNDFDNWGTSYHDTFTIEQGSDFVPFELGGGGLSWQMAYAALNDALDRAEYDCKFFFRKAQNLRNTLAVCCILRGKSVCGSTGFRIKTT